MLRRIGHERILRCVRKDLLANGRGRLLVVVASVAVSAALLYEPATSSEKPAATPRPPAGPTSTAGQVDRPAAPDLIAASAPVANQSRGVRAPCRHRAGTGIADPHHLGGARHQRDVPRDHHDRRRRQDALPWHPNGLAIDVMIPNHNSDEGIELGNQIAGLALANAKRWGVIHVIWRQGFYPGIGAPSWTADYGNETANHYDHVHIATDGGGFPTGQETYYIGSMSPATPN